MVMSLLYCVIFLNVILVAKAWPSGNKSQNEHDLIPNSKRNEDIIFPDEYPLQVRLLGNSKEDMTFDPAGKGLHCVADICDEAKDYPYERIKEVIGQIDVYNKFFNILEGSIVELPSRFKPPGEEASEYLCATITHTVYPKYMKNENNVERFIVNVEDHKQGLVFETCVENAKCKYESLFPVKSSCTQRYARRKLMALVDGNPAIDTFIVPSCCLCTFTKKAD